MATYSNIVPIRQTGPELNYGNDPNVRNIFGWRRGYNDPWTDEKNQRRMAKFVFGMLGGPFAASLLSGGFKAQDKLNPNRPFYGLEKKEDPQETRDDSPIIAQERRKLWALYKRLGRPADLAAFKEHVRQHG